MTVLPACPACGLASDEIRCPRCNALKVVGCSGGCTTCGSSCEADTTAVVPGVGTPSDDAPDDAEHPGTPLER